MREGIIRTEVQVDDGVFLSYPSDIADYVRREMAQDLARRFASDPRLPLTEKLDVSRFHRNYSIEFAAMSVERHRHYQNLQRELDDLKLELRRLGRPTT